MEKSKVNARIDALYREHKDHVYSYLLRLTNQRELAADVTQQTFVKLLTGDIDFDTLQSPKAYLFTIARNTLLDEWKRKKERLLGADERASVEAVPDEPLAEPINRVEQRDMQDKVEQAINLMKPTFRELMLLRYTEDLSVEEIAEVTGRSANDVKVNLHRARLSFDKDFTYLMYSRVAKSRERCDTIGDLLAPYRDKELPQQQIEIVAKHMSHCQVCATDMEEMKRDRKLFAAIPILAAPLAFDQLVPPTDAATMGTGSGSSTTAKGVASAKGVIGKSVAVKLVASVVVATSLAVTSYFVLHKPVALIPPPVVTTVTPPAVTPTPPPVPTVAAPPATTAATPPQTNVATAKPTVAAKPTEEKTKVKGFFYEGAPYAAQVVSYDRDNKDRTIENRFVSKFGMRDESTSNGMHNIMISNFAKRVMWMIDVDRKIYLEDKVDENGNPTGEIKKVFGTDKSNSTEKGITSMGIGGMEPCEDYKFKKRVGVETIQGRQAEKWHCSSTNQRAQVNEWFDPKIKLVIRSSDNSSTQELQEIKFSDQSSALFELPKGYRKVTAIEMFGESTLSIMQAVQGTAGK